MNTKKEIQQILPSNNTSGKVPCILIYDDDIEILMLCKSILSKSPYRVETLSQCENIITDVKLIQPDVILMDLWIPTIGGEKAIQLLKENLGTQHIAVILFSANANIKETSMRINADGYLNKPFDIIQFKKIIESKINLG